MMRTAEAAGSDRSRTGVLAYAILGLLVAEPLTGYQLAQRMRAPIGYMWTAAHSQIYPELAKLLADGQVRAAVIPGRGPRDTKRYTITTAGRQALRGWVDSPLTEVARSELLLRVRSLWLISPGAGPRVHRRTASAIRGTAHALHRGGAGRADGRRPLRSHDAGFCGIRHSALWDRASPPHHRVV